MMWVGKIDRTLKKVNDGVMNFENMFQRMILLDEGSNGRREKLEGELKNQIRKLQKMRDQIKGWISMSEVKNKDLLIEVKKKIENQMEKFKLFERKFKIKNSNRKESQWKELENKEMNIIAWIENKIDEFEKGMDEMEIKLDESDNKTKKSIIYKIENYNFHIEKLERLLKEWNIKKVDRDQILKIMDYLENEKDLSDRSIYDGLGLEDGYEEIVENEKSQNDSINVMNDKIESLTIKNDELNTEELDQLEKKENVGKLEDGIKKMDFTQRKGLENNMEMLILYNSSRHIPEPFEMTKMLYNPHNTITTPSYYPQKAAEHLIYDCEIYKNFSADTLFYIFYYYQNSYRQYLAAKELKRQSWRYHTKYLTWFQRQEEPKFVDSEQEVGTYIYFDYETGWCQRKKTEFVFKYTFLEE